MELRSENKAKTRTTAMEKDMEEDKEKSMELAKRIGLKVTETFEECADGDGIDMDAALNGTASALASLFHQYKEEVDDGITEDEMAVDFFRRLRFMQARLRELGGEE